MMEKVRKPRSDSKMYQLPKDVLDQVNDMLLNENMKYSDIQHWLETEHDMKISLDQADGNQAVICVDGYHMLYDPDENISESDIGKECYFSGENSVTLDNINKTKAGIIEGIEVSDDPIDIEDGTDRIVWVKNDLIEGGDSEW